MTLIQERDNRRMDPSFFIIAAIPVAVWIFLVWMLWKKKTNIFHDKMETKSAERLLKMLRVFVLVAGISLAVGIASIFVGIAVFGPEEGGAFFFIPFSLFTLFFIGIIGGLATYLIGRQKTS